MARTSRTGTRTDLALLGAAIGLSLTALILPAAVRSKVQGSLRASVAAPLVSAQAWAERGRMAIGDHGRLVKTVDSLALTAQSATSLGVENARLREMLGLGQRLQWGFVPTEILHPPRGSDEHTVLLAAGGAAGVRPFSPLIVPEGLVGMVTTVDASSSTAILWTHPDFRVSATTLDGLAFGIVAAHLGAGADRFLLEMRGVPFRNELKPGTMIVSSGLGNVFPRGIPIGVVLRETKTVEGWARTYLVRPIVSPDAASAAMILLPPRAAAGVAGVWSSASGTDAAQKAIVAAGDSILADSVRQVQARVAQLTLLDSLRRAAIYRGDSGVRVEGDSSPSAARSPSPIVAPSPSPSPATSPGTAPVGNAPTTTPVVTPSAPVPPVKSVPRQRPAVEPVRRDSGPAPVVTRRDSSGARNLGRSRPGAVVKPRIATDTVRGRSRPDSTRPAENPFRLPPAGGRE